MAKGKIYQGEPLTQDQLQLYEDLYSLGRQVILLVQSGGLTLNLSKVIDGKLYLNVGDMYIVIDPDSKETLMANTTGDENLRPYQGLFSNLEKVRQFLKTLLP